MSKLYIWLKYKNLMKFLVHQNVASGCMANLLVNIFNQYFMKIVSQLSTGLLRLFPYYFSFVKTELKKKNNKMSHTKKLLSFFSKFVKLNLFFFIKIFNKKNCTKRLYLTPKLKSIISFTLGGQRRALGPNKSSPWLPLGK